MAARIRSGSLGPMASKDAKPTVPSSSSVLARQPIFDRRLEVLGYELLVRNQALRAPLDEAQREELTAALLTMGALSAGPVSLASDKLLFLPASRGMLTGEVPLVFPPDRTIVVVRQPLMANEAVLVGVKNLCSLGYGIALSDFRWYEGVESVLEMVSYVKLDLSLMDSRVDDVEVIREGLARFKALGVWLIAQGVEDWDRLEECTALGFDCFQGYLLSRPQIVEGRKGLAPSHITNLRLAGALTDPEGSVKAIEEIVQSDPALGYRILQVASAGASHGMRRPVRSIQEALTLIGWNRLRAWVTLMLMTEPRTTPQETVATPLIRARLCESLARYVDPDLQSVAFTTGLLSALDVLIGIPVDAILAELSVDEEVRTAILSWEGRLGQILSEAIFLQMGGSQLQGDISGGDNEASASGASSPLEGVLDAAARQNAYLEAVAWGDATTRALLSQDQGEQVG